MIMGDNWSSYMADYVRATSIASALFFISLTIIGNVILLNLFLAIMLKEFEDDSVLSEVDIDDYGQRLRQIWERI